MNLRDLPLETMAEIVAFLNLADLRILLLSGDFILLRKLKNGGVISVYANLVSGYTREPRFRDGGFVSEKFDKVSFSPAFEEIKTIRQIHLDDRKFVTGKILPSTQFLWNYGSNLVKMWIRSPHVYSLFLSTECIEFIKVERRYRLWSLNEIAALPAAYGSRYPGQNLNLWVPIATILPSMRSLCLYSDFWYREKAILFEKRLELLCSFQRLLPTSLTEYGTNTHSGYQQPLLESLPPHLEALNFGKRTWLPKPQQLDSQSQTWPSTLTTLKYPLMSSYEALKTSLLTTLAISADLNLLASYLPHTLTYLQVMSPVTSHSAYNSAIQALPRSLKYLRLRRGNRLNIAALPPSLTHLSLKAVEELQWEQITKLPRTLTYLRLSRCGVGEFKPWEREIAAVLPNIRILRLDIYYGSKKGVIDNTWTLPAHLTHLECRNVIFSQEMPLNHFGAITQLHLISTCVEEEWLLQLPMQIYIVKIGSVKLRGILTKTDSKLLRLSGKILVDTFKYWVKNQSQQFGRDIYVVEIKIDELLVLPPHIQSISRKLRLSPLISPNILPASLTSLPNKHVLSLGQMIPALKTYKGLIIHLSEDDAPTYLSTLDPSLSSFALPQQLASSIAKQNNLPDSAFEVKLSFNCDLMALLPSSLTALTLTRQFDWSPEAPCLFFYSDFGKTCRYFGECDQTHACQYELQIPYSARSSACLCRFQGF